MINEFSLCELAPDEFDPLVLGDDGLVVVYFRSDSSVSCKSFDEAMKTARQKLGQEVNFWWVNVDRNPLSATRYSVDTIPTLLVFRNGSVHERIVGLSAENNLVQKLRRWLLDPRSDSGLNEEAMIPPANLPSWTQGQRRTIQ